MFAISPHFDVRSYEKFMPLAVMIPVPDIGIIMVMMTSTMF